MENKTCKNCKYYLQHFAWIQGHFTALDCGSCTLRYHRYKFRNTKPDKSACEFWEDNKEAIKTRNERIEVTLLYAVRQIKDIALLLKAERNPHQSASQTASPL